MATTLDHPSIGSITGKVRNEQIVQFLGIQYATISDRFAKATPKQYAKGSEVDASKLGPQVLTIPQGCDFEQSLIQHTLPYEPLSMSDRDGLNLNITVPTVSGTLQADRKLPVFVFIHGGGYNVGSNSWPQYDLSRLVTLSIEKKTPVIGVSINYRLGAPGLLTSKEFREAGYPANNTLIDQRAALIWIKQYIGGFGGDADQITVMGESAGGASTTYHLHSEKPLFRQIMPMSGTTLLMKPITEDAAEDSYTTVMKRLGLEQATAEERIKTLLEMDGHELRGKLMGVTMAPVVDGDLCLGSPTFEQIGSTGEVQGLPGKNWCEAMLIGDCQFDGNIVALTLGPRKSGIAKSFSNSIAKTFSSNPKIAKTLLSAYNLNPDMSDDDAWFHVLQVANDICFYAPTLAYARGFSSAMKTYVYRFNEPNPWDGPWKGQATHILDIAFLFQNFDEFLTGEQKAVAEAFGEYFIAFVNGGAPWEAWHEGNKKATVLAVNGGRLVNDEPEEIGRRSVMLDLAKEVGWDALSGAWDNFVKSPSAVPV